MMYRITKTGKICRPYQYGDGYYRVADPALGNSKHKSQNQIRVRTIEEVASYVRRGYSVRMKDRDGGNAGLIAPKSIIFE